MAEVILDSSALLAMLQDEPGGDQVAETLDQSVMSSVNLAEVVSKLTGWGASAAAVRELVTELPVRIAPASSVSGLAAGRLHAQTRSQGISLGDSFCLTLAQEAGLQVLTADRAWATLELGLEIRLIR